MTNDENLIEIRQNILWVGYSPLLRVAIFISGLILPAVALPSVIIICSNDYSFITLLPSMIGVFVIVPFATLRLLRSSFSEGVLISETNIVALKKNNDISMNWEQFESYEESRWFIGRRLTLRFKSHSCIITSVMDNYWEARAYIIRKLQHNH